MSTTKSKSAGSPRSDGKRPSAAKRSVSKSRTNTAEVSLVAPAEAAVELAALQSRLARLKLSKIEFIAHPDFEHPRAMQNILNVPEPPGREVAPRRRHDDIPPLLASLYDVPLLTPDQEVDLFRRFNFFKFLAAKTLASISVNRPSGKKLDLVEGYLKSAEEVRSRIIRANLRLVVSIARRFADLWNSFDDLVGDGNLALMYAVDKFDYGRGFRISTYATHAIQRSFFRVTAKRQKEMTRFVYGADSQSFEDKRVDTADEEPVQSESDQLYRQLASQMSELLDERERFILAARFGIEESGPPKTLKHVAEDLGICKERVRQLQNRALVKLHDFALQLQPDLRLPQ